MDKKLLSVGLDVGTTSTQLMVSELQVENRAGAFSVPEMAITRREIRYTSPVHFTPLVEESRVDGDKIRELVEKEYKNAGISREDVDTGAVIITGETSRKENAAAVLAALSDYAGEFVVATAGPELESVLAARGAGAVEYSRETGERVLHMDIGGGTANLAWIENGEIVATDCLNVGGRLIKVGENGEIFYISPVLRSLCTLSVGEKVIPKALEPVAEQLVQALEMAAGLRQPTQLLTDFRSQEVTTPPQYPPGEATLSFSGGVADCIEGDFAPFAFGDMGPILGKAIKNSRLCHGKYRLGSQTIRATVIGAGCHSAQLSGSTVYWENVDLPMKNLPVVAVRPGEIIPQKLAGQDSKAVIALSGVAGLDYGSIKALGQQLAQVPPPVLVAVEEDMAKALGQAIALAQEKPSCLCIDRVRLSQGDYLDVGNPIGPALPVVVKTLIFSQ